MKAPVETMTKYMALELGERGIAVNCVLDAAASKFGFDLQVDSFDVACLNYDEQHGRMTPADWNQTLQPYDPIFFGAVAWPEKVQDHVSI